ncbi:MAG: hypothetical protein EWM72_02126 [Nitrospira sp.]|nr:MAG: hypothetical protein EWM72_02126 [Nitrospira sp.]
MTRTRPTLLTRGLKTAALAGTLFLWGSARAAEYHFVVNDVGEKRAVWVPQEVVIHCSTDMQDGLVFVLENPTDRTHAFAAYGFFEEVMVAHGDIVAKPLRVNVTPENTVRVQISTVQFATLGRMVDGMKGEEQFPYFCPLHKGDAHLGGMIHVLP